MAINKNELYNLICDYYDEANGWRADLYGDGMTMAQWAEELGVVIAPTTMTALVKEGLLVAKDVYERSSKPKRHYHKPYSEEEANTLREEHKRQQKIADAKNMIKGYEDRKRRAYEIYEKTVADAKYCLENTLAKYEKWYAEAVAFLEENNED